MIVYGKNVAREILKTNKKVEKIYLIEGFNDKEIISLIEKQKIDIKNLSKKEFSRLDNYSHQGIILFVEDFSYSSIEEFYQDNAKIIILDHIEDPHNLGAIIRTCEAAGIDGIVIPKDRSVEVNSTVMKTSAGALENMMISQVVNINNAIEIMKEKGYWVVGSVMDSKDKYFEIKYNYPIALVIGSEGKGISKLTKEKCDYLITIPMKGKINSLNASVAAGIIIYEISKNI